jgi:hypothetical protein
MRKPSRAALAAIWVLAGALPARAEWHVVANESNVEVSQDDSAGSALPRFRGVGEVAADPDRIVAIIRDIPHQCEWMPDCAEARLVRSEEDGVLYYRRTDAPWPVSDRDVLLRSRIRTVEPGKEVHIDFSAVEDPAEPPREGYVRMPRLSGSYRIRALAPGRSRVELEVDADPGGSFPAWLAARTARENPIRTIVNLRERVLR